MLEHESLALLTEALIHLDQGFNELPVFQPEINTKVLGECLLEVAERLKNNAPYPHPFYIGQMSKPPHTLARLAYMLTLYINPNNHSYDGGRASSIMEKEAVAEIAAMFGWQSHLGHLTGGGTFANLEALWIAKSVTGNKMIVASEQAHYSHQRICSVLGIPFQKIPGNAYAQMDMSALELMLQSRQIGTVVASMGTTATGSVDALPEILELREKYGFRLHLDAAYGGYYVLADNLSTTTKAAFDLMMQADSIAIDPHKHGLQPMGCGCIVFKNPAVGLFYQHDSPYTYFTSADLHLGEISLECSRSGSSAVALWATQRLLPLVKHGEFARNLEKSREAALLLFDKICEDVRLVGFFPPALDIVVWCARASTASRISHISRQTFQNAISKGLHLAIVKLPRELIQSHLPDIDWDAEEVQCFRCCLMKPEHLDWLDRIWAVFEQSLVSEDMLV